MAYSAEKHAVFSERMPSDNHISLFHVLFGAAVFTLRVMYSSVLALALLFFVANYFPAFFPIVAILLVCFSSMNYGYHRGYSDATTTIIGKGA